MTGHEYPPADWTVDGIAAALRDADRSFAVPDYDAEAAWTSIATDDLTAPLAASIREHAGELREESVSTIPASHYLRWVREEGITQPEIRAPLSQRVSALSTLALAECLEREGRYLDPVLDRAWALCEQTTWGQNADVLSEPRDAEGIPARVDAADPGDRVIPLRTATVARTLAEIDHLLGNRLHDELGHSVPYVNGTKQAPGREFAASVLDREGGESRERLVLDLAGAYPEAAGLASLRRTLTLERGSPGQIVVEDRAEFVDPDRNNEAESVLVSYAPISETGDGVVATGESGTARIAADADAGVDVERIESPVTASDVYRARFEMPVDGDTASVRFDIDVAPHDDHEGR